MIRQLHQGKSVDDDKADFARLQRNVGAAEIAQIEQTLISEGLPQSEVKRLCDVHVAVFRESLDGQTPPEGTPGHPIHTFRLENEAAAGVLDAFQEALDALKADVSESGTLDAPRLARAREHVAELQEYEKHYARQENTLFPYLERHGFTGPSSVMWAIHDDVRAGWKALDNLLAAGPSGNAAGFVAQIDEVFEPLNTAIREMFYKEENILIRYFALCDDRGEYRGTLEVSQDLTPLRALEGERCLLDDERDASVGE